VSQWRIDKRLYKRRYRVRRRVRRRVSGREDFNPITLRWGGSTCPTHIFPCDIIAFDFNQ